LEERVTDIAHNDVDDLARKLRDGRKLRDERRMGEVTAAPRLEMKGRIGRRSAWEAFCRVQMVSHLDILQAQKHTTSREKARVEVKRT